MNKIDVEKLKKLEQDRLVHIQSMKDAGWVTTTTTTDMWAIKENQIKKELK